MSKIGFPCVITVCGVFSCLQTLQSHYYPDVSKISQFINDSVPKEETDLGELLETTDNDVSSNNP